MSFEEISNFRSRVARTCCYFFIYFKSYINGRVKREASGVCLDRGFAQEASSPQEGGVGGTEHVDIEEKGNNSKTNVRGEPAVVYSLLVPVRTEKATEKMGLSSCCHAYILCLLSCFCVHWCTLVYVEEQKNGETAKPSKVGRPHPPRTAVNPAEAYGQCNYELPLLLLLLALLLVRLGLAIRKLRLCSPFFYALFWQRRCHKDQVVFYDTRAGRSTTRRLPKMKVGIRCRCEEEGCGYRNELADQTEQHSKLHGFWRLSA